uniref:TGF_BETA_2 domain-containing protein n=1 Tax=Rhabditophanes sp. KR3021 TaxID=114890 RepID=A0AC35U065_9BILA
MANLTLCLTILLGLVSVAYGFHGNNVGRRHRCINCRNSNDPHHLRKESAVKRIRDKIQYDSLPEGVPEYDPEEKIIGSRTVRQTIKDYNDMFYVQFAMLDHDHFKAVTVSLAGQAPDIIVRNNIPFSTYFMENVSSASSGYVGRAYLYFHYQKPEGRETNDMLFEAFQMNDDGSTGAFLGATKYFYHNDATDIRSQMRIKLDSQVINTFYERYQVRGGAQPLHIYVRATILGEKYSDVNDNVVFHSSDSEYTDGKEMKLDLMMYQKSSRRNKRDISPKCQGNKEGECCVEDVFIDFETLGMSRILSPKNPNIKACYGTCTGNETDITTNTHFARLIYGMSNIEKPHCCFPSEFAPLKILYLNASNMPESKWMLDMVVTKCSCT